MTDRKARLLLLSACALLVLTYIGGLHLKGFYGDDMAENIIVTRNVTAPRIYRVLVPYTLDAITRAAHAPYGPTMVGLEKLLGAVALSGWLIGMYEWLRRWADNTLTLLMIYAAGWSMVVVTQDWPSINTFVECALFVWALLWVRAWYDGERRDYGVLLVLTIVASLNRSTGLFIPVMLGAVALLSRRRDGMLWGGALALVSVGIYVGLRVIIGPANRWDAVGILAFNLQVLPQSAVYLLVMFGGWWAAMWGGWRLGREPLWAGLSVVLLAYLGLVVVFGVWREVRLLMPVYPILFMLAAAGLKDD